MAWLIWVSSYLTGALLTLRVATLKVRDRYERALSRRLNGLRPSWSAHVWAIIPMVILWPVLAVALGAWKLIFPRGVRTRYVREQELLGARQGTTAPRRRIKELGQRVLTWGSNE